MDSYYHYGSIWEGELFKFQSVSRSVCGGDGGMCHVDDDDDDDDYNKLNEMLICC